MIHPLTTYTLDIGGKRVPFHAPVGDDTIYGTASCLRNDLFHFRDLSFKPGDVVLDIGCNVGLVSLALAILHPAARVFGFDASPTAIECCRRSAAANGLTNLQTFNVGLGAVDARNVHFYSNGKDHSCLVQEGLEQTNPIDDATVNIVAFETLFDTNLLGIDRVRYLKMDIEGGEFAIFERLFAARPDILERIDYLHLEVHPFKHLDPQGLTDQVKAHFGPRVFFDT